MRGRAAGAARRIAHALAHIVSTGGDTMNEGFLLRVDDRMFWDNVHASLAQEG
jgi:hypothetical protein